MDSQDDIAEERLLRLIETTGGGKSQAIAAPSKGVKGMAYSLTNGLQFAFQAWRLNFLSPANTLVREPIRYLTYIFWVILTGLAVYLVSEGTHFYLERSEPRQPAQTAVVMAENPVLESLAIVQADEKVRALQAQLEPLRQQNPFTGITQQQVLVEEAPAEPAKPQLSQLIEGLTLVGINRGAGPEAFIEDKAQNRTYFVKVGQMVRNLKVKSIGSDNSVVLELEGEEITLS